jgi:chromosome segregation ATPase
MQIDRQKDRQTLSLSLSVDSTPCREAEQAQRSRNELEAAVREYVTRLQTVESQLVAAEAEKEHLIASFSSLSKNNTWLDAESRTIAEQYTAARTTIRSAVCVCVCVCVC